MKRAEITQRSATVFLQAVIVLIAIAALALMLWEPHLEGRNVHATTFEIYFKDPFLAYAYTASIAFYVALFQAFTFLGYIRQDRAFSLDSVRALRTIKYCAIVFATMVGGALGYLFIVMRNKDDIAGGVAIGLAMMFIAAVIGATAIVFEDLLQRAMSSKSENDSSA